MGVVDLATADRSLRVVVLIATTAVGRACGQCGMGFSVEIGCVFLLLRRLSTFLQKLQIQARTENQLLNCANVCVYWVIGRGGWRPVGALGIVAFAFAGKSITTGGCGMCGRFKYCILV